MPAHRITFAAAAVAVATMTACQDSAARRRAEVQQTIAEATADLARAEAQIASPDGAEIATQSLNGVIRNLSSINDGAPGQRAAAKLLAASARRQLAEVTLADAREIEAADRSRLAVLNGLVAAVLKLDALSSGLEMIDTTEVQTQLASNRRDADRALGIYGSQLAELDGPIAEINRQNRKDRERAESLRQEAARLRSEAGDLGAAQGYGLFEQGLQLDREADEIEMTIALRELELRYDYESEHALVETGVNQLQERIQTIEAVEQAIADRTGSMKEEARTTRDLVEQAGDVLAGDLAALAESRAMLDELYEQAGEALDRAASDAKAAAGLVRGDNEMADAARLEAARAYQALGALHHARARGLSRQAALAGRIDDAGRVLELDTNRAALEAEREQAMEQAQSAFAEAGSTLGQVSGRTSRNRLDALRQAMAALQAGPAAAEPETLASDSPRRPQRPQRPTRPASAPASAGGADSPEQLLEALQSASSNAELVNIGIELTYIATETPAQEQMVASYREMARAGFALEDAIQEQFGTSMSDAAGPSGTSMGSSFDLNAINEGLALGKVSEDRGEIIVGAGDRQPIELIRVNGKWYFDGTAMFQMAAAQAAQMGLDGATFLDTMSGAMNGVAQRVRAGEFASMQDAMTAMIMAMQQAMQGGG